MPVLDRGQPEGAVRVTQSVDAVNRATRSSILGLIAIGGIVLLLGLAAGALIARQIAGPLRRLDAAAARVAEGDLSVRAKVEGSEEQRSLATTFNQMTARLERLVEGQREFVADASHQLRTPLSGLRLRLEEARAETRDRAVEEEIDGALAEVDRLSAMVTELLLLSQAGEADAPAEQVDLADAARRAATRFPMAWSTVSGAPVPPVRCAPADLDRTLDALIENALHYGGGTRHARAAPGRRRRARRGPGHRPGRARAGLRALPPRPRGPRRAARHGPRPADRARADAALGRRRAPRQPRGRRRRGDRLAALGRRLTRPWLRFGS